MWGCECILRYTHTSTFSNDQTNRKIVWLNLLLQDWQQYRRYWRETEQNRRWLRPRTVCSTLHRQISACQDDYHPLPFASYENSIHLSMCRQPMDLNSFYSMSRPCLEPKRSIHVPNDRSPLIFGIFPTRSTGSNGVETMFSIVDVVGGSGRGGFSGLPVFGLICDDEDVAARLSIRKE